MKISISTDLRTKSIKLGSRFQISDIVLFQPNIDRIDQSPSQDPVKVRRGAVKAKVVEVHFDKTKVMYDLAVASKEHESGFYTELPICKVDSIMVLPLKGRI
jgi:hypothetical protein